MYRQEVRMAILGAIAVLLIAAPALAQITTGAIRGVVTVQDEGAGLSGAAITAIHGPTGTRYTAATDDQGRFLIRGLRIGPYTVTSEAGGFQVSEVTGVIVGLGEAVKVSIEMPLASVEETLTVVSDSNVLIAPNRTGVASSVPLEGLETLPTINRDFNDFARTNPFFAIAGENEDPDAISVAGRSSRYNNIQIDGAVNNDLFGLADSGTPGGQAETTPISLDAIQEIQLVMADFDVRNGGFSGGLVNAITRSGSNRFDGSVYYFTRSDSLTGDGPEVLGEVAPFDQENYGFRVGGPIMRDELFFFLNGEIGSNERPTGWSLDGATGQLFGDGNLTNEPQIFRDHLLNTYGYDPGPFSQQVIPVDSDQFVGKLDWNATDSTQMTFRYNYVDASNVINRPGSTTYEWETEGYNFLSETNSAVLQVNSVIGTAMFNEGRLNYTTIEESRFGDEPFPWVEVENVNTNLGRRYEFEAGTEAFSTANSLNQDILELTDDFTLIKGDHTITLGTHNEFFGFENLFIQDFFGSYEFSTMEDFLAGNAWRYRHSFPTEGQDPLAKFDVNQLGFYAGDQWALRPNLTLTYGLRVDIPLFPDTPGRNPETEVLFGYRTDEIPDGNESWSPRIGFNWDINSNAQQQLRGGVGLFAGRTPYVWVSNQFSRTGIVFTSIEARGSIPFNPDPFNQPTDIGGASSQEVNLIDPAFDFPQVWRFNLAYDHILPWWGLVGTIEAVIAESAKEIDFENANIVQTGAVAFDGRPMYERVSSDYSGAYVIKNTSEGSQTNIAVKLEKPFGDSWWGYVSYAYGDSEVVNEGSSSRAVSNWQFNEAVDPNNAGVSTSDWEVEHRFNAGLSYLFGSGGDWPTTVGFYYNHQSGRPYSHIYDRQPSGSINGDGFFDNDLIYVPSGPDDVIIENGTWEQLDAYISNDAGLDSNRGRIAPRNASKSPWWHTLDIHLAQDIPVRGTKFQITFDLLNFMNLIDEDSGVLQFANFSTLDPISFQGVDGATGLPIYRVDDTITDPENNERFEVHSRQSRWRAKLGLRFTF